MDSIAAHWRGCAPEPDGGIRLLWPDSTTALLVVPSFEGTAHPLRDAFARINERKAQHLVLDLRGNQGGDPALAKFLLAHLLDTTFTLVEQGPASGRVPPAAQPFAGKVYTLMDGGCFSATGMVLAQLQLHHRGPLIGEEAGGNRTVLSGSARTTMLTHSRIACTISRKTWQLVQRTDDGHGVRPTDRIAPSPADRIAGRDEVLNTALRMSATER
ncbi:MAG: S41 family peptidase [Flavobacteriales bacterium]